MNADQTVDQTANPNRLQTPVVRFPLPTNCEPTSEKQRPRLSDLLPERWRRRVVIQGQRFWIPG